MKRILTPAVRISIVLVLFTLSLLLAADSIFKFSEDSTNTLVEKRKTLCETLAYQASFLIGKGEEETLTELISVTVDTNPDVLSMGLHDKSGQVSIVTGNHEKEWIEQEEDQSTLTQVQLPVFDGNQRWGTLQVRFKAGTLFEVLHILQHPFFKLIMFVCLLGFLVYLWFIKRTLKYLDPSALIPERVKAALDSLNEGVVFIDTKERIILANRTMENIVQKSLHELMGKPLSELNWKIIGSDIQEHMYPWMMTLSQGKNIAGAYLIFNNNTDEDLSFNINSSPIYGEKKDIRGAIVSFADMTELERTNQQLLATMEELDASHKKVINQNYELEKLATRDPLTGCLNRRAFFEKFENEFTLARQNNSELSCIMGDIDHFKKINDTYGHCIGDLAIKSVSKILSSSLRTNDMICRYGGEEFCILLVGMNIDQAYSIAERMRRTIKFDAGPSIREPANIIITTSFGVSSINFGAEDPEKLVSQADKALYESKKGGRNRVTAYTFEEILAKSS